MSESRATAWMGSLSDDVDRAYEELNEEVKELFRPALAARIEQLVEGLQHDEEFFKEARKRYKQGRSRGDFPTLCAALSRCSSEEVKEAFLKEVGLNAVRSLMPPKKQPWDQPPFDGSMEAYREKLYGGMANAFSGDLREFAKEWLEELARVGYQGMTSFFSSRIPVKQRTGGASAVPKALSLWNHWSTYGEPMWGEWHPVFPRNTEQILWVQLDGKRSLERGYREIIVSDKPLRTDKALVAALTALEGRLINVQEIRKHREHPGLLEILEDVTPFDYLLLLLRYHRPRFDDLSDEEKVDLIAQTCTHVNEFLKSLRKLMDCVEYGVPGKSIRKATNKARRDVQAAVLRDVDGLTYRRIGQELGIPPPKDYNFKGDHPTVRQMVGRGRSFLERALGEEGWQARIEAMKTEAMHWRSLSEEEKRAEHLSGYWGHSHEKAPEITKEEAALIEKLVIEDEPETA